MNGFPVELGKSISVMCFNDIIPKIRQDLTNALQITIVEITCEKGNDKEEYMTAAARENGYKLKSRFGEESWKVALEPECRTGSIDR